MLITRRSGFSLIEALVVLAIGGMALAVIFSIGTKAGDTGFKLGRKAISAADSDLAISDIRALIRSYELRPGHYFDPTIDRQLLATSDRMEGPAVMRQATTCAPLGWAGILSLEVVENKDGYRLMCTAGPRTTPLISWTRGERPRFYYSKDGEVWSEDFKTGTERRFDVEIIPEERLYVRLSAQPTTAVTVTLGSGPTADWARPDAEL